MPVSFVSKTPVSLRRHRSRLGHRLDDVGVAGVGDGHARHAVVATARGAEVDVVCGVMVGERAGGGGRGVRRRRGRRGRRGPPASRQNPSCRHETMARRNDPGVERGGARGASRGASSRGAVARGTPGDVGMDSEGRRTAGVVVDARLGEHGVVLNLRLAQRRAVVGDDDELGLAGAERLEGGLVPELVLAGPDSRRGRGGASGQRRVRGESRRESRGGVRGSGTASAAGNRTHLMTIWSLELSPSPLDAFFLDLTASTGALMV